MVNTSSFVCLAPCRQDEQKLMTSCSVAYRYSPSQNSIFSWNPFCNSEFSGGGGGKAQYRVPRTRAKSLISEILSFCDGVRT